MGNKSLKSEPTAIRALILLATLKPSGELSHTETLSKLLVERLDKHGVESEIIRLVSYNIKPGVLNDQGEDDDWPKILKKVLRTDILIFATPVWWGMQSSLMQRVIERMDELNEKLLHSGESELANKVGGIVITGGEDGAQHIIGNLANFMVWNGLTLPPACSLSYLGGYEEKTPEELLKKFRGYKPTASMAEVMSRNLVFFARLLKDNKLPEKKGAIEQSLR